MSQRFAVAKSRNRSLKETARVALGMKKTFDSEDEATEAALWVYGQRDWAVVENKDATFSVTPPTLTPCPAHLRETAGRATQVENLFGIRQVTVVEIGGILWFKTNE